VPCVTIEYPSFQVTKLALRLLSGPSSTYWVNLGVNRTRSLPILSSIFSEFLPPAFTKSASGSPAGLRRLNVARVFAIVRGNGYITRYEIGEISGLSKPTVNEALEILLKENLVCLREPNIQSGSGRPGPKAKQITYNSGRLKIIGIDIGGSKIRLLISDLDGNIIASSRHQTPLTGGRKAILLKVRDSALKILEDNRLKISDIGAIVAGSPGVIHPITGEVSIAHNLPEWNEFSLAQELSNLFNTEVSVENEAHLAIYGEHWKGGAQNLENAAAMSVGVGIGLGLLINGQVYRGFNGIAGEVGNLPLQIPNLTASPTNANFEFYASAAGLERNFEMLKNKREAKIIINLARGEMVTAKMIYQAAAQGNALATSLIEQQIELLSRGIASVCCITNPEVFIIQGGLAPALEPHLKTISKFVEKITLIPPKIVITELSDLSTAYGALRRGIEKVDRSALKKILEKNG
jgi:predicted NBD/HSP70 family sugar kinase